MVNSIILKVRVWCGRMLAVGLVACITTQVNSEFSALVSADRSDALNRKTAMLETALLAIAPADPLNDREYKFVISSDGMKLYSTTNDDFVKIGLKFDNSRSCWTVSTILFRPSLPYSNSQLNASFSLAKALTRLRANDWVDGRREFRVRATSNTEHQRILFRISTAPFAEWDSFYVYLDRDGKIIQIWRGY